MGKVYEVSVTYSRTIRPRDYESIVASVELKAVIPDQESETYGDTLVELFGVAREKAHAAIRGETQSKVEETSAADVKRTELAKGKGKGKGGKKAEKPAEPENKAGAAGVEDLGAIDPTEDAVGAEPAVDAGPDLSDVTDDFSGAAEAEISDADLQKEAHNASKKVGADKVKTLIKSFGVARLAELAADKRKDFVEKAKALK